MHGVYIGLINAFLFVLFTMPILIKVAHLKGLVDEPKEARKVHKGSVPTLGGVIIFASILFSYSLWNSVFLDVAELKEFKVIISSMVLLFFVGVKDDIIGTAALKKLGIHILVGFLLVMVADIRITSLYGLFGVYEISETTSYFLSILIYVSLVNAYNLIDGIDALSGSVGAFFMLVMGVWFFLLKDYNHAMLSAVVFGALIGFLYYNRAPAKVFMGDSGTTVIGMLIAVLAIRFIESPQNITYLEISFIQKPLVTMALLVYPLVDTGRVFVIRMINGKSPFTADKNHIHHKLMDLGWSHSRIVGFIILYTSVIFLVTISVPFKYPTLSFFGLALFSLLLIQIPFTKKITRKLKRVFT